MATRKQTVILSDYSGKELSQEDAVTVFVIIGDKVRRYDGTLEEIEATLPDRSTNVRAWARSQGYRVATKGKISSEVLRAYEKAVNN